MDGLGLDIRLTLRRLTRRPVDALVFIVALGLGLTAAATAAGVVQALLLRPYSFPTLDRLVLIQDDLPVTGVEQRTPVTPLDVEALRTGAAGFEQIAPFRFRTRTLGTGPEAEQLHVVETSASFWQALEIHAAAGRTFEARDEIPGRDGVVVLNETFWRERLGGAPMIGRSIPIDNRPFEVIGIVASRYPLAADVWVPLALSPSQWADGRDRSLQAVALLDRNVAVGAAEADARQVAARLALAHPETHRGRSVRLFPLRAEQYEFTLGLFSLVQLVAIGVLLVAAANAVTIMTVNVLDGRTESAVRAALGATPTRIARPCIIEAILLSVGAGVFATGMIQLTLPLVRRGVPPGIAKWIAGWSAIQPDLTLAVTTWAAAAATGICIGAWSSWRSARRDATAAIGWYGRTVSGSRWRARSLALSIQAGICVVLLSAAILFGDGLAGVRTAFDRYDPDRVLLARTGAPVHRFPDDAAVVDFFGRSVSVAATMPGVRAAGLVRNAPASNVSNPTSGIWPAERPPAPGTRPLSADIQIADPGGLAAIGIPLLRGRSFRDADTAVAPHVALVSRQLARRLWDDRDPLERLVALDDGSRWQIVGLVEDIRLNWYDGGARPTLYLPHAQTAVRGMTFVLRSEAAPETLAAPLRAALRTVVADPPPLRSYTLRAEVQDSLAPLTTLAWLIAALAGIACLIAIAGVYGLAASAVACRTRELGIRVVLGARPRALARLVLEAVVRPVAIGCVFGVIAAAWIARWAGSFTFGLLALNLFVPAGVGAALVAAAAAGAWNPCRHAARVDPIVTLRQ
jgi:putative ABC transport system permease protein